MEEEKILPLDELLDTQGFVNEFLAKTMKFVATFNNCPETKDDVQFLKRVPKNKDIHTKVTQKLANLISRTSKFCDDSSKISPNKTIKFILR